MIAVAWLWNLNDMNISLRNWTINDLDNLIRYANNKKIADNLTDAFPHPYTREAGEAFIDMRLKETSTKVFCIDRDGEAIGAVGFFPQQDVFRLNAEMGYWVAEPFWGQGIVTKAIGLAIPKAFALFDIRRIFARPYGTNVASQRVLEKAGFILEARFEKTIIKNGILLDELVYAYRKR
jgi:[ribosomal protein S5]-alanine N-acetyltransferase